MTAEETAEMQPAIQETYEETSGIYRITPDGPVVVTGLPRWLSAVTRRRRVTRTIESLLVTAAVVGFMGLTAFLATAHYDDVRNAPAIAKQLSR